jgi:hypothetical protein
MSFILTLLNLFFLQYFGLTKEHRHSFPYLD